MQKTTLLILAGLIGFNLIFMMVASPSFAFNCHSHIPNSDRPPSDEQSSHNSDYGTSWWIQSNNQKYLEIVASDHYQLGKQIGQQLAPQIHTLQEVLKAQIAMMEIPMEQVYYLVGQYEPFIPEDYKAFANGVAETSGLAYIDVIAQLSWMDLFFGILQPNAISQLAACTAIGTKNTIGQTFDLATAMGSTVVFVRYTLVKPHPVSVFTLWCGCWTYPMGKNNKDVMLVTNLLQTVIPADFDTPLSIKTMIALENSTSTEQCKDILLSGFPCGYNYILTDRKKDAYAIQTIQPAPFIESNVDIQAIESVAVRTNTYLKEDFTQFLVDPSYSLARQAKAEELAEIGFVEDQNLSVSELLTIFKFNDGTDASINRYPDADNPMETSTLGYIMMNKHYIIFGVGMVGDDFGLVWM